MLANLTNDVIYWRLIERISLAKDPQVPRIALLLARYRVLSEDWQHVAKCIETDLGFKLNYVAIDNKKSIKDKYSEIYRQLTKKVAPDDYFPIVEVKKALQGTDTTSFGRLIRIYFSSCDAKPRLDKYLLLRKRAGKFPAFSTEEKVIDYIGGTPVVSTELYDKFPALVERVIPDVLGQKVPGCQNETFQSSDFYSLFERAMHLNNIKVDVEYRTHL